MPQFGAPLPGRVHRDRPAAFGIARRDGLIALVRVRPVEGGDWLDLPGGAIDPGEDEVLAVVREFGEETGLIIVTGARIVSASQHFLMTDGEAVNNHCGVYAVEVTGADPALKIEDDHDLVWVDPFEAVKRLRHEAHAWAVAKWLRGQG